MAEVTWTSPALEFHQKHVGTPVPPHVVLASDMMRWQPLLTGVDEDRREELVEILEFESKIVSEILANPAGTNPAERAEKFGEFVRSERKDWIGSETGDAQHVFSYYYQTVKRKVLELEGDDRFTVPSNAETDKAIDSALPEETGTPPTGDADLENPGAFNGPGEREAEQKSRDDTIVALRIAHKAEVEALKRALESARGESVAEREKVDLWRGKAARIQADFDNYQKRVKRDQERERESAIRRILGDLVIVVDNASLVAENAAKAEATTGSIAVALESGVRVELLATLGRHGGKPMNVKPGDFFDPARHEAVSIVYADGPPRRDEIVMVVREGYVLATAILRPASVVVKRFKAMEPVVVQPPQADAPPPS